MINITRNLIDAVWKSKIGRKFGFDGVVVSFPIETSSSEVDAWGNLPSSTGWLLSEIRISFMVSEARRPLTTHEIWCWSQFPHRHLWWEWCTMHCMTNDEGAVTSEAVSATASSLVVRTWKVRQIIQQIYIYIRAWWRVTLSKNEKAKSTHVCGYLRRRALRCLWDLSAMIPPHHAISTNAEYRRYSTTPR
jgi:hypothetical protein